MGTNHPHTKSPRDSNQLPPNTEDPFDIIDLRSIPNNEIYTIRKSYEESSGNQSNRTSSEQALKIAMENPNCTTDLCKSVERQALILRQEYQISILKKIANISEESAEVPIDSDDL